MTTGQARTGRAIGVAVAGIVLIGLSIGAAAGCTARTTAAPGSPASAQAPMTAPAFASGSASGGPAPVPAAGSPPVPASPLPPPAPTRPGPHAQPFAGQPGAVVRSAQPSPTAPRPVEVDLDGCDHDYGTAGQCVPWTFPAGVSDRCGWLRAHGFGPLAVVGTDRLGLDTDHNGVACAPGDG
jgi:hypothetical protein